MKNIFVKILVFCITGNLLGLNMPSFLYAEDAINQVASITIESVDTVSIGLSKSAESVEINTFTIENPPKIVIDIFGSELSNIPNKIEGPSGGIIKQVRSAQHTLQPDKVVRVVLDLVSLVEFKTSTSNTEFTINLVGVEGKSAATDSETKEEEISGEDNIDDFSSVPSVEDEQSEAYSTGYKKGDEDDSDEDHVGISIVDNLSRQLVTLDFEDADLADVFRILSAKSGINIISGEDVEGDLTIHLEQVPFQEAFKTILSLKGLVAQQIGKNILRILTPAELTTQRQTSVTFWKVFPLNYANAKEAKKQIDAIRNAEGRRGTIAIDERTNSLIIADSPEGLDDVQRLIREIDVKPQQVLIDSRFVEVSLDKQMNLGVQWGYHSLKQSGNKFTQIGSAEIKTDVDTILGAGGREIIVGQTTGVNADIPGAIGSFQFGIFDDETALLVRLAALASEGKAKFLSNPKITTLNNKEATIWIGTQIPIRTTTYDGNTVSNAVVYKQVGIELVVTPTINVDNRITLKVRPEVSLPDTANITADGDVPINTRYAETTVLIKNNETLVIGGFIEERKTEGVQKVPLLGDIPILGQFFRSNLNSKSRRELLVFITPKIVTE